jgi:radical SAM protein with 4Fe4S-binding SPASM domain
MSTEKNDIETFYNKGYSYTARAPYFSDLDTLSDRQKELLLESKSFCMLPWVHMHAYPDGRVYPCCLADYWHPLGDLRKDDMVTVWNQSAYKQLRKNMLNDHPSKQCNKCYEQEESGFFSMRYDANRNYGHHIAEVDQTREDGEHPEFNIRYWDVRFSNLCNFRCRTCGPIFSSNWYSDHIKLYDRNPDVLGREMTTVEYAGRHEMDIWEQMQPHIPHLEQVYFAGGEPLIMKEHYLLLEKLIELGKTDVRLMYNTNFSELRYKNKHVFEYWKHFKTVNVGASLDASGSRSEILRKGTNWQQTVENRERMLTEVPHVDFYISATVSTANVLHVLDFHREWTELGFIQAKDFNVNICQGPEWYRIDILPEQFKREVVEPAYRKHLEWLRPQDKLERATNGFASAINFMMAKDNSQHWDKFVAETAKLDQVRKENFWQVFTELSVLPHDIT